MLLVSRTTLWRRIRNLESFSSRHHYTAITDSDLDELIRGLRQGFPNSGISMMKFGLVSVFVISEIIEVLGVIS